MQEPYLFLPRPKPNSSILLIERDIESLMVFHIATMNGVMIRERGSARERDDGNPISGRREENGVK